MGDATTGTLIADRYRLEHQVGEGGMGEVWVAEDEKLERWVAIKLLGEGVAKSRSVRERFEREAMAIAKLRSPHVVQIFDYGAAEHGDSGHAFIVMELLSGQDLYTWLKENRPVPLEMIARIVGQVAKALSAAHRANIVHRDLKPANIFVVRDHEEEVVKVFDFGLAKGSSELSPLRELNDRTGEGVLLGTPRYMSPEQAHGAREVDHRSDLWSLAVIAYLAISGRLPFEGRGVGEVITKIATQRPTPVSELVKGLPHEIDDVFDKALAKLPDDRYQSAMELAEAFESVCGAGRSSYELIPPDGADTFVDLTHADTEMGGVPTSADAATLQRLRIVTPPSMPAVSDGERRTPAPPSSKTGRESTPQVAVRVSAPSISSGHPAVGPAGDEPDAIDVDGITTHATEMSPTAKPAAGSVPNPLWGPVPVWSAAPERRPWLAAVVVGTVLAVVWMIAREQPPSQASGGAAPKVMVAPAVPDQRQVESDEKGAPVADEEPEPGATAPRPRASAPNDVPSATPSGESVSERGLELFEDRH